MKYITVVLTTFCRLDNAQKILDALRVQSVKPVLFLWDNAKRDWDCGAVDWRIRSAPNSKCFGRWWMLSQAETDYVMSIDDDLCPTAPAMLEKIIGFLETNPDTIIGPEGVILKKEGSQRYSQGQHYIAEKTETTWVDIVKGRIMAMTPHKMRTSRFGEWNASAEDDLLVNTYYPRKCVPSLFFRSTTNLPEGGESLRKRKDHYQIRNNFVETFF